MVDKNKAQFIVFFLILLFIFSFFRIITLVTDYMWFKSLGYGKVFMISFEATLLLFFISGLIFFVFMFGNLWLSYYATPKNNAVKLGTRAMFTFFLAYIVASISSSEWLTVFEYFKQVPFNLNDPIFFKDVSYYVFSLPFFLFVWKFAIACVIITTIFVVLDYFQSFVSSFFKMPQYAQEGEIDPTAIPRQHSLKQEITRLKKRAWIHISVLFTLFFVLLGVKHYLSRFSIMHSQSGIVVGAGYTDVMVYLPAITILMVVAFIIAVMFFAWGILFFKSNIKKILFYTLILYLVIALAGVSLLSGIIQALVVTPNEINLEKPYIQNNINFTKIAYGLNKVEEQDFSVNRLIGKDIVEKESATIENIRIIDWRPLTITYKQTQEIRLYYDLSNVDIDRYNIDGRYRQVMISPRELDQTQVPENAKTWVNLHMIYTHGYGIVMNPVNNVTDQGLPIYLIKDIPPTYTIDEPSIRISVPEIYFGEKDNDFVLVNTNTKEFDYPKGDTNVYTQYNGTGGIKLSSFWVKFLLAARFRDINIMLSTDITPESKILFIRNIKDRVSALTPFLLLDDDPYMVIDNGRLFWIQDAYTVTNNFPYSQKYKSINYMRNSVKIVIDAYNGDVSYYVIDKNDPLIATYSKIFPDTFKSYDSMPAGLKKHVRYPEGLFNVQAAIYEDYHMNDVNVFYNKEDSWQIPFEIYGTGQQVRVEPYYTIMKLPDSNKEEFVLMIPFTPSKKDNMVAWLAAKSDGDNYGELLLYKFPKDKLIYGPSQIEAKIDQDSLVSQQVTLWSQQGSKVTRGNMMVIPIENSILYVEPLYLESEKGQLPELKRVIVSDGERVVMGESLGKALDGLFDNSRRSVSSEAVGQITGSAPDATEDDLIQQADIYYNLVLDSMKKGDWASIGVNFDKLGSTIDAMKLK